MDQKQGRAWARLNALGVDPFAADVSEVKALYEAERARYVNLAENGLHMAPSHGLYGMLVAAVKDYYGWSQLPDDWSPERPEWPGPVRDGL